MTKDTLPVTIPQMIAESFETRASFEAFASDEERLTYAQLDERVARTARALIACGAGKGTRIALMMPDGAAWFTNFLAITRIGAVAMLVSTFCSAPELAHILRHSDAQLLIAARKFLRHDYGERLVLALPSLASSTGAPLYVPEAPFLRSVWLDDADGLDWAGSHRELLALADGKGGPPASIVEEMTKEVVPSDDALVIYTSGSTALPKGVLHVHRSVARHSCLLAEQFRITSESRMMPLLPAFWVGGLQIALEVLHAGGTLIYPVDRNNETVLDTLERYGVNRINVWGPQMAKLRDAAVARGVDVDAIRGLGDWRDSEGKLIPPGRAPNMLGMSESWGPHSSEPIDFVLPEHRAGASGRSLGGIERRVVHPETGEVLPPGATGELQLRGGALMKGYYKVDRDAVFTADGFYPTNDLVRIEEDGYLFFIARQGDMLKTSGANVSRLEVEAALRTIPDVDLPIVVGLPDEDLGQLVAAAVVPKEGRHPTEDALKQALREKISSYKVPRRIVIISADDVQWTPSNKVKLAEMKTLIAERIGQAQAAA